MADKYINADKLNEKIKTEQKNNANMGMSVIYDWFIETIKNEPNADVQPVKSGHWENTNTPNHLRCSKCEIIHFIAQYPHGEINFCPNCGARMDGAETGERL